jgi:simple sugar transport system permease protein
MTGTKERISAGLMAALGLLLGAAVVLGLTTVIVAAAGAPPLEAYRRILSGAFGSWVHFGHVLRGWIPLTLAALGLLYTFRIGLWNIGVEGQVMIGAVAATAVLRLDAAGAYPSAAMAAALAAAMLGGALWAWIGGVLKTVGGVNEIFAGLGLNFVAQGGVLWLIFGPWRRPGVASMSGTELFAPQLWLATVGRLRVSPLGMVLVAGALAATAILLGRTRIGLNLKAVGSNRFAAALYGLRPSAWMLLAMGLAGGLAGLAGAFQAAGVYHRLIPAISSNYGYLALLVVMLADYRLAPVLPVALFFAALNVGSIQLPMVLRVDSSLSGVIQGTLVLATLGFNAWRQRATVRGKEA